MHDSATTMLMRCKMAGINHFDYELNGAYTCALQAPSQNGMQTPTENITPKLPPAAQRAYVPDRQSHRTTRKGRGSLRLAPIKCSVPQLPSYLDVLTTRTLTDHIGVVQVSEPFAFLEKSPQDLFPILCAFNEQLVDLFHRDRLPAKLSLVHSTVRSSVYLPTNLQVRRNRRQWKPFNQLPHLCHVSSQQAIRWLL